MKHLSARTKSSIDPKTVSCPSQPHSPLSLTKPKKAMALTVVNMPSHDLATTGCIYVNPVDARAAYVTLSSVYGTSSFVYRCAPHPEVPPGHVALNAVQRRLANAVASDQLKITDFLVPMRDFEIRALPVQAEWLKSGAGLPPRDLTALANAFRAHFLGHVLTNGQKVCMDYGGNAVLFTVRGEVRGLVTMSTEVHVEFTI